MEVLLDNVKRNDRVRPDMDRLIGGMAFQEAKKILPQGHWEACTNEARGYAESIDEILCALKNNRDILLNIIDLIPVSFFVKDHKSRFFLMNRACAAQWGMSFAEMRDTDGSQFFPPDQMAQFLAADRSIFQSHQPLEFEETFWSAAKQENRTGLTFKRPIYDASGAPQYLVCVTLDITERKNAERALADSELRLRTVLDTNVDGIVMIDVETTKFLFANRAFCDLLGYGYASDEIAYAGIEDIQLPKASAEMHWDFELLLGSSKKVAYNLPVRQKNGSVVLVDISTSPMCLGGRTYLLACFHDVTERKRAEEQVSHMAHHDPLTGLSNRRFFVEALNQTIARARQDGTSLAVLYLDIDHFKDVNDTLGHPTGDLLLQAVAQRLRASVRATDTVARFGGDEFAVILGDISDHADAATISERLLYPITAPVVVEAASVGNMAHKVLHAFSDPFLIDGNEIYSGTSIGIAVFGPESPDAEAMLAHADLALYEAKSETRGIYRFFNGSMETNVRARVAVDKELREAIASDQLFLLYQPQVDIYSGQIVGLEALVRWNHPTRGTVGPADFVPVAERSGLIITLGQWVIHDACRQIRAWLDAGIISPSVAVNFSVVQFKRARELEKDIATILARFDLPARLLELELTETVLMDASREHNDLLIRFRKAGHRIAIDDFGSGYSSLDYLRRYPVDRIKIAQSFTADVGKVAGADAIVRAALSLAHELHIEVVVEGAETAAQFKLLKAWGCRIMQGYYFSRPLSASEIIPVLQKGRITPTPAATIGI